MSDLDHDASEVLGDRASGAVDGTPREWKENFSKWIERSDNWIRCSDKGMEYRDALKLREAKYSKLLLGLPCGF